MRFWGWVLKGLVVVLGIVLIALQSQGIKKFLLETLLNQSFEDSSLKVDVGFVRGLFPFQFTVASLDLKDEGDGSTWVSLKDVKAEWSVPDLLAGTVKFHLKRGEELAGDLSYFFYQACPLH